MMQNLSSLCDALPVANPPGFPPFPKPVRLRHVDHSPRRFITQTCAIPALSQQVFSPPRLQRSVTVPVPKLVGLMSKAHFVARPEQCSLTMKHLPNPPTKAKTPLPTAMQTQFTPKTIVVTQ